MQPGIVYKLLIASVTQICLAHKRFLSVYGVIYGIKSALDSFLDRVPAQQC
jgi:hypothetical protein